MPFVGHPVNVVNVPEKAQPSDRARRHLPRPTRFEGGMLGEMVRRCAPVIFGFVALACNVPVAANLDESDANQAATLLEQASLSASKERDPEHEGRYRITVINADAAAAIGLLARESLPPRASPGVLEALGEGSVIPSRLAEQA